jgi:hypothetical protein
VHVVAAGNIADRLVTGLVAGVAVVLGASLDRLKLGVEALEKTPRVMVSVNRGADSSGNI